MPSMDVFNTDPFSMTSLTALVEEIDYVPDTIGSLNIFEPEPVTTREVFVERANGTLSLIPTTEVGSPPTPFQIDKGSAVPFKVPRLAKSFTVYAHEVDGIRARGSETELRTVQIEYARRMAKLRRDMEATHELHRLGALQGIVTDADGGELYNFFTSFGVSQAAEIDFALDTATTDVLSKCAQVIRQMRTAAKGSFTTQTQVHALCGPTFYDKFRDHPKVRDTYTGFVQAAQLREAAAFESFRFGNITFHDYRGTDDGSSIAITDDQAKFFPVGAVEFFSQVMAPAEFGPFVNTRGQNLYAMNIIDRDRQAWTQGELYSYPLYMCKRPNALQRAVADAGT